MVICLDPSALHLIQDLMSDKADTRLLLIDSEFSSDYVRGHIGRVGLAGAQSAPDVVDRLVPTVRADLEHEAERLRDMDYTGFHSIAPWRNPEENAAQLARFLDVAPETALELARTEYLFSD